MGYVYIFFFFFQAEDGIRDLTVTGVQTCALPISVRSRSSDNRGRRACGEPLRLEPGESLADDAEMGERRTAEPQRRSRPGGRRNANPTVPDARSRRSAGAWRVRLEPVASALPQREAEAGRPGAGRLRDHGMPQARGRLRAEHR